MSTPFSGGVPVCGADPAYPFPSAIRMPVARIEKFLV